MRYMRAPGTPQRIVAETLGSELRPVQIAARDTRATDVQFADHPQRHRLTVRIQQVDPRIGDRPADRTDDCEPSSASECTVDRPCSVGPYSLTMRTAGAAAHRSSPTATSFAAPPRQIDRAGKRCGGMP